MGGAFVLNKGVLDTTNNGYTISGGFRQPLGPAAPPNTFFDLGLSYLAAYGNTTRLLPATFVYTNAFTGDIIETRFVADAFRVTLDEVRRAGVHAALGWYWGEPFDNVSTDPQLRVALRAGGRWGHIHGSSDGPDVLLIHPFDNNAATNDAALVSHDQNDNTAGVFIGVESILLYRPSRLGDVKLTLDAEFANDWVNFTGFESGNLTTASIMLGAMFSR
jgi:hypothetical protein